MLGEGLKNVKPPKDEAEKQAAFGSGDSIPSAPPGAQSEVGFAIPTGLWVTPTGEGPGGGDLLPEREPFATEIASKNFSAARNSATRVQTEVLAAQVHTGDYGNIYSPEAYMEASEPGMLEQLYRGFEPFDNARRALWMTYYGVGQVLPDTREGGVDASMSISEVWNTSRGTGVGDATAWIIGQVGAKALESEVNDTFGDVGGQVVAEFAKPEKTSALQGVDPNQVYAQMATDFYTALAEGDLAERAWNEQDIEAFWFYGLGSGDMDRKGQGEVGPLWTEVFGRERAPHPRGVHIWDAVMTKDEALAIYETTDDPALRNFALMLSSNVGRELSGASLEVAIDPLWLFGPAKGAETVATGGKTYTVSRPLLEAAGALEKLPAGGVSRSVVEMRELVLKSINGISTAEETSKARKVLLTGAEQAEDAAARALYAADVARDAAGGLKGENAVAEASRVLNEQAILIQHAHDAAKASGQHDKVLTHLRTMRRIEEDLVKVGTNASEAAGFLTKRAKEQSGLARAMSDHAEALRRVLYLGSNELPGHAGSGALLVEKGTFSWHIPFSKKTHYLLKPGTAKTIKSLLPEPVLAKTGQVADMLEPLTSAAIHAKLEKEAKSLGVTGKEAEAFLSNTEKFVLAAEKFGGWTSVYPKWAWTEMNRWFGSRFFQPLVQTVRTEAEASLLGIRGAKVAGLPGLNRWIATLRKAQPEVWDNYNAAVTAYFNRIDSLEGSMRVDMERLVGEAKRALAIRKRTAKEGLISTRRSLADDTAALRAKRYLSEPGKVGTKEDLLGYIARDREKIARFEAILAKDYGVNDILLEAGAHIEAGSGLRNVYPELWPYFQMAEELTWKYRDLTGKERGHVANAMANMARFAEGNPEKHVFFQEEFIKRMDLIEEVSLHKTAVIEQTRRAATQELSRITAARRLFTGTKRKQLIETLEVLRGRVLGQPIAKVEMGTVKAIVLEVFGGDKQAAHVVMRDAAITMKDNNGARALLELANLLESDIVAIEKVREAAPGQKGTAAAVRMAIAKHLDRLDTKHAELQKVFLEGVGDKVVVIGDKVLTTGMPADALKLILEGEARGALARAKTLVGDSEWGAFYSWWKSKSIQGLAPGGEPHAWTQASDALKRAALLSRASKKAEDMESAVGVIAKVKKTKKLADRASTRKQVETLHKKAPEGTLMGKDGKPLVLYHGTPYPMTGEFKVGEGGIFFATDPVVAAKFAGTQTKRGIKLIGGKTRKGASPNITPVTISPKKLFDPRDEKATKALLASIKHGLPHEEALVRIVAGDYRVIESFDFQRALKAAGYDGYMSRQAYAAGGKASQAFLKPKAAKGINSWNYAVFSPEQVRSAILPLSEVKKTTSVKTIPGQTTVRARPSFMEEVPGSRGRDLALRLPAGLEAERAASTAKEARLTLAGIGALTEDTFLSERLRRTIVGAKTDEQALGLLKRALFRTVTVWGDPDVPKHPLVERYIQRLAEGLLPKLRDGDPQGVTAVLKASRKAHTEAVKAAKSSVKSLAAKSEKLAASKASQLEEVFKTQADEMAAGVLETTPRIPLREGMERERLPLPEDLSDGKAWAALADWETDMWKEFRVITNGLNDRERLMVAFSTLSELPQVLGQKQMKNIEAMYPSAMGQRLGDVPEGLEKTIGEMRRMISGYEDLYTKHGMHFMKSPEDMLRVWGVTSYVPHLATEESLLSAGGALSHVGVIATGNKTAASRPGVEAALAMKMDARKLRQIDGTIAEINAMKRDLSLVMTLDPLAVMARYGQANKAISAKEMVLTLMRGGVIRAVGAEPIPGEGRMKAMAEVAAEQDMVPLLGKRIVALEDEILFSGDRAAWEGAGVHGPELMLSLRQTMKGDKPGLFSNWFEEIPELRALRKVEDFYTELRVREYVRGEELTDVTALRAQGLSWKEIATHVNQRMQQVDPTLAALKLEPAALKQFFEDGHEAWRLYVPRVVVQSMDDIFGQMKLQDSKLYKGATALNTWWKTRVTVMSVAFSMRNAMSNVMSNIFDLGGGALNPVTNTKGAILSQAVMFAEKYGSISEAAATLAKPLPAEYLKSIPIYEQAGAKARHLAAQKHFKFLFEKMSKFIGEGSWLEEGVKLGDGMPRTLDEAINVMRDNGVTSQAYTQFVDVAKTERHLMDAIMYGTGFSERVARGMGMVEDAVIVALPAMMTATGGLPLIIGLPKKFGGQVVARSIENQARIVNFIGNMKRSRSVGTAAEHVQKFLFNYGDLSAVQKSILRLVFPFFTWNQKNLQLQMELMQKSPVLYSQFWRILMEDGPRVVEAFNAQQADRPYAPPQPGTMREQSKVEAHRMHQLRVPMPFMDDTFITGLGLPQEAFVEKMGLIMGLIDPDNWGGAREYEQRNRKLRLMGEVHFLARFIAETMLDHHTHYDVPIEELTNGRLIAQNLAPLGYFGPVGQMMQVYLADRLGLQVSGEWDHKTGMYGPTPRISGRANHVYGSLPWSRVIRDAAAMTNVYAVSAIANPVRARQLGFEGAYEEVPMWIRVLDALSGIQVVQHDPALQDALRKMHLREARTKNMKQRGALQEADLDYMSKDPTR